MMIATKFKNQLLQWLFPPFSCCLHCGDKRLYDKIDHLCPSCRKAFWADHQGNISVSLPFINQTFIPFNYEGVSKKLIHQLKFQQITSASLPLIQAIVKSLPQNLQVNNILPIPLYKKREKQRGFNQAEILAQEISPFLHAPLFSQVIIRSKNTTQQTTLTKIQRKENLKDAFTLLDKEKVKNQNILLIDDVLTTGATASSCAKVLKEGGAKQIYLATVAYAPLTKEK